MGYWEEFSITLHTIGCGDIFYSETFACQLFVFIKLGIILGKYFYSCL
jgi:hypothetical protein